MCGRYAFLPEEMERGLVQTIARMNRKSQEQLTQGQVRPGDTPPAIVMGSSAPEAVPMRWGMSLPEQSRMVINARSESIAEKPMFSGLVQRSRCLLPAALYYEWTRTAARTRMQISCGRSLYMAGLFRRSAEAAAGWEFVILTRDAVGDAAKVHDRMPLILPDRDSRRGWLTDAGYAQRLLQAPPEVLCSVRADGPEQLDMFDLIDGIEI